jgi:hypothetical protein
MPATWDMHTSGDSAGQLIRPLQYTATEADATRVRLYLMLSTNLGTWRFDTEVGLDYSRIFDPLTSDNERTALVRDIVLDDPGIASILVGPEVSLNDDKTIATISVTALAVDGTPITIGT